MQHVETESPEVDSSKTGGLGKKMKNISLTMRKKMGRKYTKALSEETVRLKFCTLENKLAIDVGFENTRIILIVRLWMSKSSSDQRILGFS